MGSMVGPDAVTSASHPITEPRASSSDIFRRFNFIPLVHADFKRIGPAGKELRYLHLQEHYGKKSLVLVTRPNCVKCLQMGLKALQTQKKCIAQGRFLMVYYIEIDAGDSEAINLQNELGLKMYPDIHVCDSRRGRLTPWVGQYESEDPADPQGDIRFTPELAISRLGLLGPDADNLISNL